MKQRLTTTLLLVAVIGALSGLEPSAAAQDASGATLDIMTFNVWHGLRSGESRKKFPGEDPGHQQDHDDGKQQLQDRTKFSVSWEEVASDILSGLRKIV